MDEIDKIKDHYAFLAISTAFISIIFFSSRDVILRYYRIYKNYSAFEMSLDALTLYAFVVTLTSIYLFTFADYTFFWKSFTAGCMCAVLNTLGFMMLGIAVVIGYAGPANALGSI